MFPGGFNNQGGYPPQGGYQSQGGYPPPPNYDSGSYPPPPHQQQAGGYYPSSQGNISGSNSPGGYLGEEEFLSKFDFDENMDLNHMIHQMTGTRDLNLNENELQQSARSIQGFDPDSLQSSYSQFRDISGGSADRGLFGSGKSPLSHQVLAGAAAWIGTNWWFNRQKNMNKPVSHAGLKKFAAATAAAMAVKWWEKSGGWQSGMSREAVAREAAQNAMLAYDAKHSQESQPQYQYNYNTAGGEASSYDNFGAPQQNYYQGGGSGYPPQGGYPPY